MSKRKITAGILGVCLVASITLPSMAAKDGKLNPVQQNRMQSIIGLDYYERSAENTKVVCTAQSMQNEEACKKEPKCLWSKPTEPGGKGHCAYSWNYYQNVTLRNGR